MLDLGQHAMRRETGWTWRCQKPGTWVYAFRVTWSPGSLALSGDVGDLIVNHYSFNDPWAAAAWVNGAGFDYFMEKTSTRKEYDSEATAEHIVETAYQSLREGGHSRLMERIADRYGDGDHETPDGRKSACRELLGSSSLEERDAYDLTEDPEMLVYEYPGRTRGLYEAFKWWAARMWDTEPAWHKAVRLHRRIRSELAEFRRHPVVFGPVLYATYDAKGQPVRFNGATYWRWRFDDGPRRYQALMPFRLLGRDLSRFGLWRLQGSSWPDTEITDRWGRTTVSGQFIDVRRGATPCR